MGEQLRQLQPPHFPINSLCVAHPAAHAELEQQQGRAALPPPLLPQPCCSCIQPWDSPPASSSLLRRGRRGHRRAPGSGRGRAWCLLSNQLLARARSGAHTNSTGLR